MNTRCNCLSDATTRTSFGSARTGSLFSLRWLSQWRRTALSLAWVAYAALLTFLVYSALIQDLFGRPGALLDDILLLESAWIFIEQSWGWTDYLYVGLWVVAVAGFGTLLARYLKAVWQWGAQRNPRHVIVGGAVLSAYCLLSLSWFGVGRDDPLIQLQAKQVFNNWQRSQLVLATVDALNNTSLQSAARLAETIPVRRPDIFLFEVESYGATLWADDDYAVAREGLMRRVESELATLQLPMLSRFATSPVYGGGSWMSKASALSGMKIETHSTYSAWTKLASRYPHLIAYLNRQGYYTLAIQPASLSVAGLYDYDDVIVRSDLSYNGFFYGFGHVPDQWSLEYAFENHWSRGPRPRLFHFSAVSTHFAWESPPRITEDVAALEEPQPSFLETQPYYVELALTVPQGRKRDYFVTIAYEWELMLEAFRHRIEPGFIALIYGDHQPPFIAGGRGGNDVAVHVVTDIPDLPGPLATAGFTAGAESLGRGRPRKSSVSKRSILSSSASCRQKTGPHWNTAPTASPSQLCERGSYPPTALTEHSSQAASSPCARTMVLAPFAVDQAASFCSCHETVGRAVVPVSHVADDPVFQRFGTVRVVPTARTLSRWLRHFTMTTVTRFQALNAAVVSQLLPGLGLRTWTVDVDGVVVSTGLQP